MYMYRVLAVDDEPSVIDGLSFMIPWESLGFCPPVAASDGKEALAKMGEIRPHLVITDIRMPIFDGLDFISECSRPGITTEFIILSAHPEFKYAQEAIRLGVRHYLLKPPDVQELTDVLREVKAQLDAAIKPIDEMPVSDDRDMRRKDFVTEAKDYIDTHYTEDVSVAKLAKLVHCDAAYLGSLFQKRYGSGVKDYQHRLRIEKAAKLLETSDIPINAAAAAVGYKNYNNFFMHFERVTGMRPVEYPRGKGGE